MYHKAIMGTDTLVIANASNQMAQQARTPQLAILAQRPKLVVNIDMRHRV